MLLAHKAGKKLVAVKIHHAQCSWGWKTGQRVFSRVFWSQFSDLQAGSCFVWSLSWVSWDPASSTAWFLFTVLLGEEGEPLKACVTHLVPTKASCATRGLAGGLSGNCVGGSNGQDMTFAIRSSTDLPTGFIATFGAIYAGHVFKYVADLEPRNSYMLH